MGGAGPRRHGRPRRVAALERLALLGLALLSIGARATAREPQGHEETLRERWDRLELVLEGQDAGKREAAFDELGAFLEESVPEVLAEDSTATSDERIAVFAACQEFGASAPGLTLDERVEYLDLAYELALRTGSKVAPLRARLLHARLLSQEGRNAEARTILERALHDHGDAEKLLPWAYWELAEICRQQGDATAALTNLDRTEASLYEGVAQIPELIPGLRAQLFITLGLPGQAEPWVEEEQRLAEESDDPKIVVASQIHRANLALITENFSRAIELVGQFLQEDDLYSDLSKFRAALLVIRGISESHLEREDPDRTPRAAETLEEALREPALKGTERIQAELRLAELRMRHLRFSEAQAILDGVRRTLAEWTSPGWVVHAPERAWLATLQSRLLLDEGEASDEELEQQLERSMEAFQLFLEQWAATPIRRGGIGFLQNGNARAVLSELIRLSLRCSGPRKEAEQAFQYVLDAQRMGTLARRLGGGPCTLEAVREELIGPGQGLLVLLPAPDRSHVFAVDRSDVHHVEIDHPLQALKRLCADHLALVATPPTSYETEAERDRRGVEERRAAHELAEALLPEEIQARMEAWTDITIVGGDLLAGVPFECLPTRLGPYLGISRPITHLPSLPLGLLLAERGASRARGASVLVFAAPHLDGETTDRWGGLAPLPFDDRAASRLTQPYDPRSVTSMHGSAANRARFLESDLEQVAVLQFLGHAVLDPTRERPSALVLGRASPSDEALLWSEDVEALRAPRLVLLTACSSGRGPTRPGDEGTARMSSAWLFAGSDAVVQSWAPMDYSATLLLSEQLHRELAAGATPARGLQRARESLARLEGYSAPFYHGLVQVVGLGNRPVFEPAHPLSEEQPGENDRGGEPGILLAAAVVSIAAAGLIRALRSRAAA